ncbi:hypothetical protein MYOV056v2_p0173 [Vibrio phage 184E37.3a]|nr:hypothetical protein MYOV056v2_p0173 [Vibrio phage 184E37.3a]QZI90132.1 hypothetical protein MYOV057v1_p0217 [Vibrio phage 184E37.1]
MTLDEMRIDWLEKYNPTTGMHYIRKLELWEVVDLVEGNACRNPSIQQLNWLLYLKGLRPITDHRSIPLDLGLFKIAEIVSECYEYNYKLKEDYWYLEELYQILREES